MHDGHIDFYRVKIERHLVDLGAVRRRHGLELMLGSAVLAGVMGPDEDLTKEIPGNTVAGNICFDCAVEHRIVTAHEELVTKAEAAKAEESNG